MSRLGRYENRSLCPVCDRLLPASEIEAHCNAHFESAPNPGKQQQQFAGSPAGSAGNGSRAAAMRPAPRQHMAGNFISMLARALEAQQGSFTAALCGDLDHYQTEGPDAGWGCGYRNLQMMVSHLKTRNQETEDALFDGLGFVPDIASLQVLLEQAWALGWDSAGCEQLGGKVRGSRTWIGATECVALLRSYGLRAKVVDFDGSASQVPAKWSCGELRIGSQQATTCANGSAPNEIHPGVECDACSMFPVSGACYNSQSRRNFDLCQVCHSKPEAMSFGPYCRRQGRVPGEENNGPALVRWVWQYFTEQQQDAGERRHGNALQQPMNHARRGRVIRSNRTPLYFQHQGHSRTIVGIEKREVHSAEEYNLLVLDPHERSRALSDALLAGRGWQRMLKRGMHTLREPEYQLVYLDDGIMTTAEREDSKVIHAVHF